MPPEQAVPSTGKAGWRCLFALLVGIVIGAIVGRFFPPFVLESSFWRSSLTSSGFGGAMAVVAAAIAYYAARHAASSNRRQAEADREQRRRTDRKAQWWARAEWALNQTTGGGIELGYRVLNALANSEWADQHEADVVAAATDDILSLTDPETAAVPADEPGYSTRVDEQARIDEQGGASK